MCNEESGGAITPYVKDEKLQPKFVFDGITRNLDNYLSPLEPKSCRIITFTETIDACRKTVPMSIRLYGKNTDGNDCMNYMFRKIFMEKIVRPPISEPSPTTVTNTSPVVAPKPSTETNPNPSPVVAPTITKPDPSPVSTCNPDDAIITEVAVPQIDGSDLRYVEIFFKDCAGRRIKDDVKVGRGDNPTTDNVLDLIYFLVPTDGYVVICSDLSAVDAEYGAGTCDKQSPVANNEGYDPVAIVKGPFDANREILDIFGFPNDEDRETPDIKDGRAVRIKPNENSPTYVPEQWFIYPGVDGKNPVGPKGMDPGVWLMPIIITEIVDPDMGTNAADVNYAEAPRFIEMYVPNTDLHGKKIGDDLKLVLFRGDEEDPSFSPYVSLKDIDIPDNGVIVVCNQAGGAEWGTNKCDIIKTDLFDLRGGYFGCDRAAIVHGNNKDSYSIIDMYGLIGVDCADTMHDFIDGRGVRLSNSTIPEPIWNIFNWEVISGVSPDECKPGSWPTEDEGPCNPDDAIITEVSVPQIDGSDLRYVEIFFKDCAGRRIKDDVKVGRGDNPTTDNVLDLIYFLVPTDGYVVICSDLSAVDAEYGAGTCDKQSPVANNEGYDPVAIVKGPFDANREILDIFGFPNDEDRETPDIKDGRAVRIKPNENSPTYVPEQWFIYPGVDGKNPVGPKGMDPGVWLMPIIITEIVDPDMGTNAADVNYAEAPRFIEMYVPNTDLHGKKIGDDLKLVLFRGDEEDPSFSPYVSLKDIDIPDNGVIVVCNQAGGAEWGTNKCDIIKTDLFDLRGGYFGCDRAAIVHGNNKDSYSIIDMYGLIGVDCADTMHDFIDGRGVRLSNSTIPEPIWNIFNWEVISGVSPDECKPGSWPEQADPKPDENAPPSPANTPPPAPTKGGKGDKSDKGDKKGKSPGLRRRRRRAALL